MNQDVIAGLLGPWSAELGLGAILLRAALSVLFSAVIGCERSSKRHSAGLRTFILVSITGTAAMLTDRLLMELAGVPVPVLSAAAVLQESDQGPYDLGGPVVLRTDRDGAWRGAVYAVARAVSGAALQHVRSAGAGKAPQGSLESF